MRTVQPTRPVEQAEPEWLMKPLWRRPTDAVLPGGKTGLLKLADGQVYLVEPVNNATVGEGLTLVKSTGELFFLSLDANRGVGTCSCKAFMFRKANLPCKHLMQVREALMQLIPDAGADVDPFADEGEYDYSAPRAYFGDVVLPFDEATMNNWSPPSAPAALPVPSRKPNHRFVADVA